MPSPTDAALLVLFVLVAGAVVGLVATTLHALSKSAGAWRREEAAGDDSLASLVERALVPQGPVVPDAAATDRLLGSTKRQPPHGSLQAAAALLSAASLEGRSGGGGRKVAKCYMALGPEEQEQLAHFLRLACAAGGEVVDARLAEILNALGALDAAGGTSPAALRCAWACLCRTFAATVAPAVAEAAAAVMAAAPPSPLSAAPMPSPHKVR